MFLFLFSVNLLAVDLNLNNQEKKDLSESYYLMWIEWNSCWYNINNKMTDYADKILKKNLINNYEKFELNYWYQVSDKIYEKYPSYDYSKCKTADPSDQALKWQEKNKWFGVEEDMTNYAFLIHENLVKKEGVIIDSYEYYYEIDKRMREKFPTYFKIVKIEEDKEFNKKFKTPVF